MALLHQTESAVECFSSRSGCEDLVTPSDSLWSLGGGWCAEELLSTCQHSGACVRVSSAVGAQMEMV